MASHAKDESPYPAGTAALRRRIAELEAENEGLRRDFGECEQRFRQAVEAGQIGVWSWDVDSDTAEWNHRLFSLLGLDADGNAVRGDTLFESMHPEDRPAVTGRVREALKRGEELDVEFRALRADGAVRWLVMRGSPCRDESGRPVRWSGVSYDITAGKSAERLVRRERDNLTRILDAVPDAVYIVGAGHEIRYTNPAMRRQFGPIAGKKCYEYMHDANAPCPSCRMSEVEAGRTVRWEGRSETNGKHYDVLEAPFVAEDGSTVKLKIMRDVSERKVWESALDDLARFPAENPNPVLRVGVDGALLYANSAAGELLRQWDTGDGGRVPAVWVKRVAAVLRADRRRTWNLRVGKRLFAVTGAPVRARRYVNLYVSDITRLRREQERRREEAKAAASSAALVAAVRAMGEGVVLMQTDGTIVTVNPAAEALIGRQHQDLVGKSIESLLPELLQGDDLSMARAALPYLRRGETPVLRTVAFATDGGRVHALPSVAFVGPSGGEARTVVLTLKDITALRETSALLERVFDNTHVLIAYLDTDMNFVRVNRAYARADGRNPGFFIGRNHFDLFPHEDNQATFRRVIETGEPYAASAQPLDYSGHLERGPAYWDWTLTPVRDETGPVAGLVLCLLDVTTRIQAEQLLLGQKRELRALASELSLAEERERRRLAAGLHDHAGQTLTIARLKLQMIGQHLVGAEAAELHREALSLISQVSEQVRTFTFELSPPVLYQVGLGAALDWLSERFERHFDVLARCEASGDWRSIPEATSVLLFQSARELLANVGKHAGARQVTVGLMAEIGTITMCVEDDGVGFDVNDVETLGRKTHSFGLFSIRERMRHIGGSVEIVSSPGSGTTVTLRVPV